MFYYVWGNYWKSWKMTSLNSMLEYWVIIYNYFSHITIPKPFFFSQDAYRSPCIKLKPYPIQIIHDTRTILDVNHVILYMNRLLYGKIYEPLEFLKRSRQRTMKLTMIFWAIKLYIVYTHYGGYKKQWYISKNIIL